MSTLNAAQLASALQAQGASPAQAAIGAAIALAESGGRSSAVCLNCAGVAENSQGPWQINLNAHPSVSSGCAQDVNCAAAAVRRISSGFTNWNPWSTFTGGQYQSHLGDSASAVGLSVSQVLAQLGVMATPASGSQTVSSSTPILSGVGDLFSGLGSAAHGVVSAPSDVAGAINTGFSQVTSFAKNALLMILGVVLLLAGGYLMFKDQAQDAVQKVAALAPAAEV